MYNDTTSQGGYTQPISPGTEVYDVNGDKIGAVQRYDPQANVFMVEKGLIFKKDLYIPTRTSRPPMPKVSASICPRTT